MMREPERAAKFGRAERFAAFGVHVFTACGAGLALMAMLAAVERRWTLMFVWLGVALIVDAIDGTFARLLRVRELAPRWSGDVLDLVVDILTYVFVPAYALMTADILPAALSTWLALAIVVTAALYFADTRMKSADNCFIGFPAIWNIAAFYLFVLRPPPWVAAGFVVALCVLTFVPLPFVHPFRVVRLRAVNLSMLGIAGALAILVLAYNLAPPSWAAVALCLVAVYFIAVGLLPAAPAQRGP
jgi:phosphatidylcholine synthase